MSRAAGGNGFLTAAGVATTEDFPLTVELQFDAILHFTHQNHVVKELFAKLGGNVGKNWRQGWGTHSIPWTIPNISQICNHHRYVVPL